MVARIPEFNPPLISSGLEFWCVKYPPPKFKLLRLSLIPSRRWRQQAPLIGVYIPNYTVQYSRRLKYYQSLCCYSCFIDKKLTCVFSILFPRHRLFNNLISGSASINEVKGWYYTATYKTHSIESPQRAKPPAQWTHSHNIRPNLTTLQENPWVSKRQICFCLRWLAYCADSAALQSNLTARPASSFWRGLKDIWTIRGMFHRLLTHSTWYGLWAGYDN